MSSNIKTGNAAHDATCLAAEVTRQAAVAGATQAQIRTAEANYYLAIRNSALANGLLGELGELNKTILQLGGKP